MKTITTSILGIRRALLVVLTVGIVLCSPSANSQSRSHNATVTVNQVTVIALNPGLINLDLPNGPTAVVVAGVDEMTVTDQSTTLLWGTNAASTKITITDVIPVQLYQMKVEALAPSTGSALTVMLTNGDHDFITNMLPSSGSVNIRYTGIALASQGIGSDSHALTFTIVGL